jgi:hypothetical protein
VLRGKIGFKLRGRQITERGVKPFPVVDFLQKLADADCASARSRYSLRWTSSYFSVFINDSQAALSHGFALRDMLMAIPFSFSKSV